MHYKYFGTLDFKAIADFISSYSTKLGSHPNDVCVLSLSIQTIRELDFHFRKTTNEKSYIMAETKEFYDHLKEQYGQTKNSTKNLTRLERIRNYIFG